MPIFRAVIPMTTLFAVWLRSSHAWVSTWTAIIVEVLVSKPIVFHSHGWPAAGSLARSAASEQMLHGSTITELIRRMVGRGYRRVRPRSRP